MERLKTFKTLLNEDDFAVIKSHVKKRHIGILSASREKYSPEENSKRYENLGNDLKGAGLKPIPVTGRYIHNFGTPEAHPTDEDSYFVHGDENLLGHPKKFGQKYDQDSVLHKAPGENAMLHGTNHTSDYPGYGKSDDVGAFHPNEKGEFHSVTRNGKAFTFRH